MSGTASANLTQLGSKTESPKTPDEAVLEVIEITKDYIKNAIVRFSCPEFTSLCPVTGQPDFARFYIDFQPDNFLVESKSLKLFMTSFRNHGAFHEDVTSYIGDRLMTALTPKWIRVVGIWYPRGGIPIDIIWSRGRVPDKERLPLHYQLYEGR